MLALSGRIFYWQVVRGSELRERAINQQTNRTNITASRGTIYDRNGKAIAESATVNTLVCNPQQIAKDDSAHLVASKLSGITGMDYDKLYSILTKSNRYQVIKKRITVEETDAIKALRNKETNPDAKLFSGIYFEEDSKRYYSYGIAPHIIGFTGYDNNGLQGIEMTFDGELAGKAGSILSLKNAAGITVDAQYEEQE